LIERCERDFFSMPAAATAAACDCENETDGRRRMETGAAPPFSVTLGEGCDSAPLPAATVAAAAAATAEPGNEAAAIEARRVAGSAATGERAVLIGASPDGRRCDAAASPLPVAIGRASTAYGA
jgi:hypothetical protein